MGIEIRLPNITASDTEGKMSQMQSYMHQLVEQLNWALSTVDNAIQGNTANVAMTSQNGSKSEEDAVDTFNSIKALIIKSADIVTAYEESMREDFNGEYVAVSDFGKYKEDTNLTITKTSHNIEELFTSVETITNENGNGTLDNLVRETEAVIKRGELGTYKNGELAGKKAVGVAVGEKNESGEFKSYAWFTATRLSFLDDGWEIAYISQNKLHVSNASFTETVMFGNYKADMSNGLAFVWVESEG